MPGFVCSECRESVAEDASVCPHCGYNPSKKYRKSARNRWILAALLFASVIGTPIALYVAWKAWKQNKRAKTATPAVPA